MFPVWLRDGVALANIPCVICGDSEEVSSEPPRARTPPNDGNYKERGGVSVDGVRVELTGKR